MKNINLYKTVKISFVGILLTLMTQSALAFTSKEQQNNYIIKYGVEGQKRLNELNRLIKDYQYSPIKTKLKVVNDFFNKFSYLSDKQLWGQNDYWTTPIEFLGVGMGDCEDYAIAKFDALIRMGINKDKLRLIYAISNHSRPHMVLGYYATDVSRPLILDNLNSKIILAPLRTDLLQIYAFNKKGVWIIKKDESIFTGNANRLSLWKEVNIRTAMRSPTAYFSIIRKKTGNST